MSISPQLPGVYLYIQRLLVSNAFIISFHLVFSPCSEPQHQTEPLVEETGTLEDRVSPKVRTTQQKGQKQVGGKTGSSRNVFLGLEATVLVWGIVSRKAKLQSHKEDLERQADKVRLLFSRAQKSSLDCSNGSVWCNVMGRGVRKGTRRIPRG